MQEEQHIIFVPGKNPKPPVADHHRLLWLVLEEGLRRHSMQALNRLEDLSGQFQVSGWNPLCYDSFKDPVKELPWIEHLLAQSGPSPTDLSAASHFHLKLSRLVYQIADVAPFLIGLLASKTIKDTVKETERYFHNHDNIARRVREVLKQQLRPLLNNGANILLIGHSLGSVIAYDTLWELCHEEGLPGKVDTLLTLGSPLGMHYVQHRLVGWHGDKDKRYPLNIRHWVNVAAEGDLTAVDRCFQDDFGPMLQRGLIESITDHCRGVYNFYRNEEGLNCHRSYGYLINPRVAQSIAEWLLRPAGHQD